ncbi:hypothetical protein XELAEV_18006001mg [Xenopus laevis]|uniref:Uncharacterized protein n=1 Tax=Xenopus laevis TaxID=8355 RepID=A0A974E0B7_XENLA|nr:hypothetical protein XELAEV_18006001mg [Xenopus laevis]
MDNRSRNLDISCGDVAQSPGNNVTAVVLSWGPVFCLPLQWPVVYYTPRQKSCLMNTNWMGIGMIGRMSAVKTLIPHRWRPYGEI